MGPEKLRRAFLAMLLSIAGTTACGNSGVSVSVAPKALVGQGSRVQFRYATPEGASIGDTEMLGRETLLFYMTTYDNVSLAVARRLVDLWRRRVPRFNAVLVALEPPQNAPLVAVYRDTLAQGLVVTLADSDTLNGGGTFGDLRQIPAIVLLDRDGRIVFRGFGVEAYRQAESLLESGAESSAGRSP